ncbi:MAG TPA: hypothetical protein VLB82_05045 [Thermodesulfobacteriota bacterium]|nr:hypothetical protein [Thermodesulfobacteriota bacterium]
MNQILKKHISSLTVLIIFSILAIGTTDTDVDTKKVQSQSPAYTLTANQLYNEYKNNEVAADSKYKGKIVVVSGTVQDIGKDIMNEAYIVIGGTGLLDGVQCMFTKGQQSSVAKLSKGQQVKVKGEVSSLTLGVVLLFRCSVQ